MPINVLFEVDHQGSTIYLNDLWVYIIYDETYEPGWYWLTGTITPTKFNLN